MWHTISIIKLLCQKLESPYFEHECCARKLFVYTFCILCYYATVAVTTSGNWYFYAKKALLYHHRTSIQLIWKKAIFPNRKNCFIFIRGPLVRVKYTVHFHSSNVLFCNFALIKDFVMCVHRILKGGPSPQRSRILTAKISWQVT